MRVLQLGNSVVEEKRDLLWCIWTVDLEYLSIEMLTVQACDRLSATWTEAHVDDDCFELLAGHRHYGKAPQPLPVSDLQTLASRTFDLDDALDSSLGFIDHVKVVFGAGAEIEQYLRAKLTNAEA